MSKTLKSIALAAPLLAGAQSVHATEVLFIDSYHAEYKWSAGITRGVEKVMKKAGYNLTIHRMDTKRNGSEEFKQKAAAEALKLIEAKKPDAIIACDDNAAKYLIEPHLKNKDIPVVFCGLNWDASHYGFPAKNVTGMVEVAAADELIELLLPFAKGNRVGLFSSDTLTEHKEVQNIKRLFGDKYNFTHVNFVKNMANFEEAFLDVQSKSDIIIFINNAGIEGWDDKNAQSIIEANAKIPLGTFNGWLAPYVMASFSKVPEEQGEWTASTVVKIIEGAKISDIPLSRNVRGNLVLNARLAQKIKVDLPAELIEAAGQVIE